MTVIVLSGPIRTGKSSSTNLLVEHLDTQVFYEDVDNNPILPPYYKDTAHHTFLLSACLLNHRLAQINRTIRDHSNVSDRSVYEGTLFSRMNIDNGIADPTKFRIYDSLLENMMKQAPGGPSKKPDLLVYIHISLDTILHHIRERNRTFEQLSTDPGLKDYYARLLSYYESWYEKYNASPKMMTGGDKYDFIAGEDT